MALSLGRKVGEKIVIGGGIVIEVLSIARGKVRLGITAPKEVPIRRDDYKEGKPQHNQRRTSQS